MKYRILFDYGSEGMHFPHDEPDFDTVDDAVRHAVALNYGNKFIIVYVAWEPKYQPAHKDTV